MQSTSALYQTLLQSGARAEYKLTLNDVDYTVPQLRSMVSSYQAFSENVPTVGCCIGAQLDVVMDTPDEEIPRGAELTPYARLFSGSQHSEWLPKKTYWISTRSNRESTGRLTIKAFDAMGKTEQPFLTGGDVGLWPQDDVDVVTEIAERIGVSVASDTTAALTAGYQVPLPTGLTMREVLGYIGVFYCGNWIITADNKLRLLRLGVPLSGAGVSVSVANRFMKAPAQAGYTMVRLYVSDQTTYEAGTDTGAILDVDCPWGTQQICNDMLQRVRGYAYAPFEATGARIHPAVELGDRVSIGNVSSILYLIENDFRVSCKADIAAPQDSDPTEEFPYLTAERKIARKISGVTASLSILEDEIISKVSAAEAQSMINQKATQILATVSDNYYGKYTAVDITSDGLKVNTSGSIELAAGASFTAYGNNFTIDASGNVNVKGTFSAAKVYASNLITQGQSIGDSTQSLTNLYSSNATINNIGTEELLVDTNGIIKFALSGVELGGTSVKHGALTRTWDEILTGTTEAVFG